MAKYTEPTVTNMAKLFYGQLKAIVLRAVKVIYTPVISEEVTGGGIKMYGGVTCQETLAVTGNTTVGGTLAVTGVVSAPVTNTSEITTGAGAGVTGGTGTIYKTAVEKNGAVRKVTMLLDLTGLDSAATLGDIIGTSTDPAHFGSLAAGEIGTALAMRVECLETPAGGEVDIDIYEATEATGVLNGAIGDLAETAVLTAAADWSAGDVKYASSLPTAGKYLYLTTGTDSTPTAGTYTAGKFLIEIVGTA